MKELIEKYIHAWSEINVDVIDELFANDAIYSESYGPEYVGKHQIMKWYSEWNKSGRVLVWEIKQYIESGNTAVIEWYFECCYNNEVSRFDGVSIFEFNKKGKIQRVREFSSTHEHSYPYED